jgi:TolB-like protein/cytochrome c-type biogenesis protein CcmH/NrfG
MTESETFAFGRFRLSVGRRELSSHGLPVPLGSRAFDLLLALLRRHGQLLSKDELMTEVWPDTVVEENNLQVQISALRKILREDAETSRYLLTVPGRGYRFVAAVEREPSPFPLPGQIGSPAPMALPDKPSIAVLPFTNMSGDSEQDYFADGIVEDIITALTRFPSLFVIARNSSFTYKGRAVDIKQVGRELGVRYVLEGSVRKAGNRVRITGQLVQAETGTHVWAERQDRDLDDIFALQDEMSAGIVGALVPSLQAAEIERARGKPPENLDAYDLYLRALPAFYSITREGNDQALQWLARALTFDSSFVSALILLENCWAMRFTHGWSPVEQALAESIRYARLAVQLDPDNAEALATLARRTAHIERKFEEGMSLAERAVAANPNSAYAWRYGGWAFIHSGRSQTALTHFERALRLSPRDPRSNDSWTGIAVALIQLERDQEAVAAARKAVQHNDNSAPAQRALASALALAGQSDEAKKVLRSALELDPGCSLNILNKLFAFQEKARARYHQGLRQAGMPE